MEELAPSSKVRGGPVERSFRLLQTIVAAGESIGIRELGRRTGLPRSTVSRLVGALTDLGMVARAADGAVMPGSALATLQLGASTPMLSDQLRPLLVEIAQTFGESAALSIDDGDALLYLAGVRSDHPVSAPDVTRQRHAFHLVAPGLITLASWAEERLDAYVAHPLSAATSYSVTDADALRPRLHAIREQRFAWTNQELDVGVNGLAVLLVGRGSTPAVTISLYGPSYRFSPDVLPDLGERLLEMVTQRAAALMG